MEERPIDDADVTHTTGADVTTAGVAPRAGAASRSSRLGCRTVLAFAAVALVLLLALARFAARELLSLSSEASAQGDRGNPASASIVSTLDGFMTALAEGDFETAVALVKADVEHDVVLATLEDFGQGANAALLDGYENLSLEEINLNWSFPGDLLATVTAAVSYSGGYNGTLQAELVRLNGQWRISDFSLSAPPEKMESYIRNR